MKALLIAVIAIAAIPQVSYAKGGSRGYSSRGGVVSVRGYTTRRGTYVAPSHRTAPNSIKTDNWSSRPNVNPFTGKEGTKDPYSTK